VSPESVAEVAAKIRTFYESCSFPGYESSETLLSLSEKARKGVYARVLDEQLPLGVRVLDAGCGTGQLAIFLSAMHRQVVGADFSFNSLSQGNQFKKKWQLSNMNFVQMDLLQEAICEQSFDFIFCNGVLHHTADAYGDSKTSVGSSSPAASSPSGCIIPTADSYCTPAGGSSV
jgi:ubiquinone/menaquinone biosynthesis C-methylase UbiE